MNECDDMLLLIRVYLTFSNCESYNYFCLDGGYEIIVMIPKGT